MKKLFFILIATSLFSCKKDDPTPEPTPFNKNGIYTCTDLTDDSTGLIVDPRTHLNISFNESDVKLNLIITNYGYSYFHNITSDTPTSSMTGILSGNTITLNSIGTWRQNGIIHTFISGTLTIQSDNSITLNYTESVNTEEKSNLPTLRSYTGHFSK